MLFREVLRSITRGKSTTSSGSDLIRLTTLRTSCLISDKSLTSCEKVMTIEDTPALEVEVNLSMPVTLLNSSSMTLVIFCSTSSGEAPG